MSPRRPAYLCLPADEIEKRASALESHLESCRLCPRNCDVDRTAGETGWCRIDSRAVVASFGPHFGEERPLVGLRGSGTVFFAGCNLGCVFCQNADISHRTMGRPVSADALGRIFVEVQERGCHNLNLVTPSHVAAQILRALVFAMEAGLRIPIVWNSGGYDSTLVLDAMDGIVDIYMPDFKLWRSETSSRLLQTDDYPEVARRALTKMHAQVGDLRLDEQGIAERGLLVRHLVLPNGLADTAEVATFVAGLSPSTYFNLMDQYHPCHRAFETEDLSRIPDGRELQNAREACRTAGLARFDE